MKTNNNTIVEVLKKSFQ